MHSRLDVVKSKAVILFLPALVLGLSLLTLAQGYTVAAVDTEVGVSVCGADVPAAQITINEPLDDSVVSNGTITFRGTVANATQVEVAVDDEYNNTISVPSGGTSFEVLLTLTPGTHTVTMTANAICGAPSATTSTVITYQPATQPSNGGSTPTEVGSDRPVTGVVIATERIDENAAPQAISRLPIVDAIVNQVKDLATIVGLQATVAEEGTPLAVGAARVGVTVAALAAIVTASSLAPMAAQTIPGLAAVFSVRSHRSMVYLGWIIRGVGVAAMALTFLL